MRRPKESARSRATHVPLAGVLTRAGLVAGLAGCWYSMVLAQSWLDDIQTYGRYELRDGRAFRIVFPNFRPVSWEELERLPDPVALVGWFLMGVGAVVLGWALGARPNLAGRAGLVCSAVAGGAAILGAYRLATITPDLETASIPNLHQLTVEHTLVYAAALSCAAVLGWISRRGPATSAPAP